MALSTLTIDMVARTTRYTSGIQRAQFQTKAFVATVSRAKSMLFGFAGSLLAVAGVGGMTMMIKKSMQTMDSVAKLSDRIGVATESLVGLGQAASLAGISQEELFKNLEMFSRRLGEAKTGVGEAKRALDSLGWTAADFVGLSTEEAFYKIADAIQKQNDVSTKALLAYGFFGRSGQRMINLMDQGSKSIKEQVEEMKALGLAYNRIDAAKVEEANDALNTMRAAWQGIGNSIAIVVSPMIETAADKMKEFVAQANRLESIRGIFEGIAKFAGIVLEVVNGIAMTLNFIIGTIQRTLAYVMNIWIKLAGTIQDLAGKIGLDLPDFQGMLEEIQVEMDKAGKENWNKAKERFLRMGDIVGSVNEFFKDSQSNENVKRKTNILPSLLSGLSPAAVTSASDKMSKAAGVGEYRSRYVGYGGLAFGPDPITDNLKKQTELLQSINEGIDDLNDKDSLE